MPDRDKTQSRTWFHRRFLSPNVPERAHIYPDGLQLEDLESNASSNVRRRIQAPVFTESSSTFHLLQDYVDYFDAFRNLLVNAIMPIILSSRYYARQFFASTPSSAQILSAHGTHMIRPLKVVYRTLGFHAVFSYLGFLQMVLDIKKGLNQTSSIRMYHSCLGLLRSLLGFGGHGNEGLPYDRLVAQPPYLASSQCCFICFDLPGVDAKAVQVHLKRPTKHREIRTWTTSRTGVLKSFCYRDVQRCDWAVESDADVYSKIKRTSLSACGGWFGLMPFYGVKSVREVEFDFRGGVNRDGSFPIVIHPIDLQLIRKQVNDIISSAAADDDPCQDNACDEDSNWHSNGCKSYMSRSGRSCIQQLSESVRTHLQPEYHSLGCQTLTDNFNEPCIQRQAQQAIKRKKKLDSLSLLTKCTRYPQEANGEMTLEGMASESFVLQTRGDSCVVVPQRNRPYDRSDRRRGLQITIGWQHELLSRAISSNLGWTALFVSIIWLCTVWWMRGTRDVSTAMAFGQLLAASISLAFLMIKH